MRDLLPLRRSSHIAAAVDRVAYARTRRASRAAIATVCTVVLSVWSNAAVARPDDADEVKRLNDAAAVLGELTAAPDRGIPRGVLEKAEAVAIFPGLKKGGFIVGAQWGRGMISVRNASGWSPPAFLRVAGGSFGFQIGAQAVDLVLVVMNRRGVENLLRNEFKIGGEASATAGPVGREAGAATDIQMRAEILSYSRSRGLFAGATINGASIQEDRDANQQFYGEPLTSQEVVGGKAKKVPAAAGTLTEALSRNVPPRNAGD